MMFDKFLDAGLIPIGGDDDKLQKLLGASKELEQILLKDKTKIINYTLVALDEKITEEEIVLKEVETIVKKQWQLVRGQFDGGMPIRIYQGIILQALYSITEESQVASAIIWLTGKSIYPLLSFSTKMEEIIKTFLEQLGDKVEEYALTEWTIDKEPKTIRIPNYKLNVEKINVQIDEDVLKKHLIAASGPHGQDAVAIPGANQHWPNSASPWSYQFAPRAAKGITKVVNESLSQQNTQVNKYLSELEKQSNDYFTKLKKDISSSLKDTIQSSVAVERRSQLLWWKETLYSRSQRKSYRDMGIFQATIAMAFDLFELLPSICPVSVDYILKETFFELKSAETTTKINDFLLEMNKEENIEFVDSYFPKIENDPNRMNLITYMSEIVHNKVRIEDNTIAKIGILGDKEIAYEKLSIWILHNLMAKQLSE